MTYVLFVPPLSLEKLSKELYVINLNVINFVIRFVSCATSSVANEWQRRRALCKYQKCCSVILLFVFVTYLGT